MSIEKENNFAVFVSGYGRGAIELIKQSVSGEIVPKFALLVSTDPLSKAIDCAAEAGIPIHIVEKREFNCVDDFESDILKILCKYNIAGIFLAGFKYLLSENFIGSVKGDILNIHPSLLPAFKGHKNGIQQALEYGVKISGVTIHKIDKHMDEGKILYQRAVPVCDDDNLDTLDKKIFAEGVELTKLAINHVFL